MAPGLTVPCWSALFGTETASRVLVVGNGASRRQFGLEPIESFARDWGPVIGCNSIWREMHHKIDPPDYLVCFDAEQLMLALDGSLCRRVLFPFRPGTPFQPDLDACRELGYTRLGRLYAISPFEATEPWSSPHQGFDPWAAAHGNLSGLLAFQLAVVLGAHSIFLHGLDCCGTLDKAGRVQLSSIPASWTGYEHQVVSERHCEFVGCSLPVPRGWQTRLRLWRRLTDWALDRGIDVYRLRDTGAMTWLPVAEPDGDAGRR